MTAQMLWGSLLLGICSIIHLALLVFWIRYLSGSSLAKRFSGKSLRTSIFIGGTFAVIVASHTVQVWVWAGMLVWLGAMAHLPDAIYFSLVTYTTVGYGDVTLREAHRIFGAMASVTGVLNFGISTAVLVSVISRVLDPKHDTKA